MKAIIRGTYESPHLGLADRESTGESLVLAQEVLASLDEGSTSLVRHVRAQVV